MNSIVVCGNLGQDPVIGQTTSGRTVTKFSIADDRGKDANGAEIVQWFNCRAYDRTAELIHEHFCKGKPIFVEGAVYARQYDRDDGSKGLSLDLQVSRFEFVPFGGPRREQDPAEPTPPTPRTSGSEQSAVSSEQQGAPAPPDVSDPFKDQ